MTVDVWQDFRSEGVPSELVDELRETYEELKENFYLGNLRPSEVEGGRFAEAALRIIQWSTGGLPGGEPYTPLSDPLPRFDREVERLRNLSGKYEKSLRVWLPRVLHSIYNIRNSRDAAHLSGDVDPNLPDSMLVATNADWVMAEFVRLFHGVKLQEAQARVDALVTRRAPAVEMFGDVPKVLRPDLENKEKILLILFNQGEIGATAGELGTWLNRRDYNVRRDLRSLDEESRIHFDEDSDRAKITRLGVIEVEDQIGLDFT